MNLRKQQRGVSLIEVLVTLILISIGLLGTASLQILSKRSNFEAAQRTTAAHLANDLFQRMRSNRQALVDYLDADGSDSTPPLGMLLANAHNSLVSFV